MTVPIAFKERSECEDCRLWDCKDKEVRSSSNWIPWNPWYNILSHKVRKKKLTYLAWTAPELLVSKPYSKAVDVFSYGIIMWELLSG